MYRRLQVALGVFVGAAVLALGAGPGFADHYRNINPGHLFSGISQLNYVNVPGGFCIDNGGIQGVQCFGYDLTLKNPNHDTQVAATLVYTNSRTSPYSGFRGGGPNFGTPTEVFLGCRVDVVTSHGSIAIASQDLPGAPVLDPTTDGLLAPDRYAETIWAPLTPVQVPIPGGAIGNRRLANGLGGRALAMSRGTGPKDVDSGDLAHPRMFSLPDDGVVPGQRNDALICVCSELNRQILDPDTFRPFKFDCPK